MSEKYIPSFDKNLDYINRNSSIHRWESRSKIVSLVFSTFLISALNTPKLVIIAYLFLLILLFIMGMSFKEIIEETNKLLPFLILMCIPILFAQGLPIEENRKNLSLLLFFKGLSGLNIMLLVFFSQETIDLIKSLSYMRVPDTLMSIMIITWRYVFVLGEKLKSMYDALKSRLFKARFNKKTFNTMGQVMGGMLIKSLDTSDTVYNAMVSRGFNGSIPTSTPDKIKPVDILKSFLILGFFTGLLIIERWCF